MLNFNIVWLLYHLRDSFNMNTKYCNQGKQGNQMYKKNKLTFGKKPFLNLGK